MLFVGNIHPQVQRDELASAFRRFGMCSTEHFVSTTQGKFAFVRYDEETEAKAAYDALQDTLLSGHELKVEFIEQKLRAPVKSSSLPPRSHVKLKPSPPPSPLSHLQVLPQPKPVPEDCPSPVASRPDSPIILSPASPVASAASLEGLSKPVTKQVSEIMTQTVAEPAIRVQRLSSHSFSVEVTPSRPRRKSSDSVFHEEAGGSVTTQTRSSYFFNDHGLFSAKGVVQKEDGLLRTAEGGLFTPVKIVKRRERASVYCCTACNQRLKRKSIYVHIKSASHRQNLK